MSRKYFAAVFALAVLSVPAFAREKLKPLPPAPKLNAAKVALGKKLFFDTRLSGDATISCASCHIPEKAFADGLPLSAGYPSTLYFRNTPSLLNTAFKKYLYWDGRFPKHDLQSLVRDSIAEAHFLQADGRLVSEKLRQVPEYQAEFKKVFGGEPSYGKILKAVEAYVLSLVSVGAPIDRYLAGNKKALSKNARRGLKVFTRKAGCVKCHNGALLSDGKRHNIGVPENRDVYVDPLRHITFRRFFKTLGVEGYQYLREDVGYYAVTKNEEDKGKFVTPSLREVARTAPYMHNGMFKTLEEVVDFKSPNLSARDKGALVEFLKSLSGKEIKVKVPVLPDYKLRILGKK